MLLDHFFNFFSQKMKRGTSEFSAKAVHILLSYPYPGNVRELRNIVEYAVNVCCDKKILPTHLPAYLAETRPVSMPQVAPPTPTAKPPDQPGAIQSGTSWPEVEKQIIMDALIKAKGNRMHAAKQLGWARSTLWRKIKQYGIDAS